MLKFWKAIFCYCWMPLYIGGDSDSNSSTHTTNNTTTSVTSVDQRNQVSEQGIGVSGNFNHITQTDFGSVNKSLDGVTQMGSRAIDLGQFSVGGAIDVLKQEANNNRDLVQQAFGFAKGAGANAMGSLSESLGLAKDTTNVLATVAKQTQDTATGNRSILLVALGVLGIVAAKAMQ